MSTYNASHDPWIETLNDWNYSSWFINIRAKLRPQKLWKYTQSPFTPDPPFGEGERDTVTKKRYEASTEWEEKCQEAAYMMTLHIDPSIQLKLTKGQSNDGFLMLSRLQEICQTTRNTEFIRLFKEYFTLNFSQFKTISKYLARMKDLEEQIDATNISLDSNNRTILCLSLSLPPKYQYLVQIWAITPDITAEKARRMLLDASRHPQSQDGQFISPSIAYSAQEDEKEKEKEKCNHCNSTNHITKKSWNSQPEQAPECFQQKLKAQKKVQQAKMAWDDQSPKLSIHMSLAVQKSSQ